MSRAPDATPCSSPAASPANAATDRRSLRTRGALRDAMVALIAERGWDNFGVQDLCERANVGRSTFYSHYTNKDALLVGGFASLQAALQQQARVSGPARKGALAPGSWRFLPGLIEHVQEQRRIFRVMIGRHSAYVVQLRFREMVIRLLTDELPPATGNLPRPAAARWLAAGLVELLSWWVEQRAPLPPAELAALFDELSSPVLRARKSRPGPSSTYFGSGLIGRQGA